MSPGLELALKSDQGQGTLNRVQPGSGKVGPCSSLQHVWSWGPLSLREFDAKR